MLSNNRRAADRNLRLVGRLITAALWLTPIGAARPSRADVPPPVLLDEMDGARPVLQLVDTEPGVRVVRQAVESGNGSTGNAEHLTLAIPPGASAALAYPVPQATIIDELRFETFAWCNRPGMQLAAMVVLPRTNDEATGHNRQLLVRSGERADGGTWQQLTLTGLRKAIERSVRVARAKYGPGISELGAYVSHVVILAPGGAGPTEVWVDQVAMYGGALRPRTSGGEAPSVDLAAAWTNSDARASPGAQTPRRAPPAVPRIIQWQGEPLELLQKLGFDATWMGRLPSSSELAEANRLGLWLVCPPPSPDALAARGVGHEFDGVLAWDLGELNDASDIALADRWARALEQFDPVTTRPTVLRTQTMAREASRVADVMALGRSTVGSTATWLEHASWLSHARRLSRPGVATWIGIDSQRSRGARVQWAALTGDGSAAGAASYAHITQAVNATLGAWPRGFWFPSQSSLAGSEANARMRSLALELTNLRLGLIEPWLAGGKAATAGRSSQQNVSAIVMTVERSHLVIPMRWGEPSQVAPGQRGASQVGQGDELTLVLPGVPESCEAYVLSVAGPRQISTRRVTGGLSVTVEHMPDDALLLLTEDGYAFSHVEHYLRSYGPRAAQARVELAALRRQQAAAAAARLSPGLLQSVDAARELAAVDASMTAIHRTLISQDYAAAYARAAAAEQVLEQLEEQLVRAMWPNDPPGASPLEGEWETLPELERVAILAASSVEPPSAMPGGEFEDLEQLLATGWRRSDESPPGVAAAVRLSPNAPHGGNYCLELEAKATTVGATPPALATPPVWITSPPLSAPAGRLIEITGWARVTETPIGSADPLLVFDSIGGEESAVRMSSAPSWTRFRLLRVAPAGAECRVTIALGGVGRAAVDSMQYRVLPLPDVVRAASR